MKKEMLKIQTSEDVLVFSISQRMFLDLINFFRSDDSEFFF